MELLHAATESKVYIWLYLRAPRCTRSNPITQHFGITLTKVLLASVQSAMVFLAGGKNDSVAESLSSSISQKRAVDELLSQGRPLPGEQVRNM